MPAKNHQFDARQHMRCTTYEIFRYKDAFLREVALHHHDFYEIYFFLSGKVQYNIESRSYLLTPGDILLISPLELHQPVFGQEPQSYERIVLWIDKRFLEGISPPGIDLAACFNASTPGHANLLRPEGSVRQFLSFLLEQLMEEKESQEYAGEYFALSYLVQILVVLNRQALRHRRDMEAKASPDSVVYQILSYINEHYSEDLTLDDLANRFFMSKYHLSREFGRLVGTSVHRYIVQKRLVMAKQMMQDGSPATEVYPHCGFGDYSNFYRAFKAEYQITPREFAARLKQNPPRAEMGLSFAGNARKGK